MSTSQNGYKSRDSSLVATYTVARDIKLTVRKGDVSVVLLHFARWYDQHIEPLTKADTGGYNPRTIADSKVDSNHASGTAMDLRWNKHARGKANTFTAGQKAKIREQLKYYDGVIRWGEEYTKAKVDGMHYEINKPSGDVRRVADKIRKAANPKPTPTAPKPPSVPTKPARPEPLDVDGILGPDTISRWQEVMGTTVDGKIDEENSELIRAVQRRLKATVDHRIVVDGKPGPKTIGALQRYLKSPVDQFISKPKSQMVMALQRRLNAGKF